MKLELGNLTPRHNDKKSAHGGKRTQRSSQTLTFVFFVGLAFFFWILQRMQGELVRTISIQILTDSLSANFQPTDSIPRFLEVEVQDRGFEHLRYSLDDINPIQLRVYKNKGIPTHIGLDKKEITTSLAHRLSSSAVVLRQNFSELLVDLNPRSRKELPVKLTRAPYAGAGYTASDISFVPDTLVVFGPLEQLDTISAIVLPNRYDDLEESISDFVPVKLPKGLHSDTKKIQVNIEVEELTEQTYTLPIIVRNVPEGYKLLPLPNVATIQLTIPRSKFAELSSDDIELVVEYTPAEEWEKAQGASGRSLEIRLAKSPKWLKRYTITPERIQFVLEH